MNSRITFLLDDSLVQLDFVGGSEYHPTTTVLQYLRSLPGHRGVKEGCAEGDCGACTVVLGERTPDGGMRYLAADACLLFLPMLHGRQLITVENLRQSNRHLHPVQQAMVDHHGSQCGFCTPGIVMSLFALTKNAKEPSNDDISSAVAGNLCRCTGYRPILEAAAAAGRMKGIDDFTAQEPEVSALLASIPSELLLIKTPRQRYDQPSDLEEALALVAEFPGASVLNGATDVALRVTKRFERIPHIIDLSHVQELKTIRRNVTDIWIGAGASINQVRVAVRDLYPALHTMLNVFAAEQIRNVATLGGNLGTASPVGDILPVLIAYGSSIELRSTAGTRTIPADRYVIGYRKTERKSDELITAIILPMPVPGTAVQSYKISKRRDLDISAVSGGFRLRLNNAGSVEEIVLAYGGMAERTKRATTTETFFLGKAWTRDAVEQGMSIVDSDFSPISDVRGSAAFRRIAARNLLMKFWTETT